MPRSLLGPEALPPRAKRRFQLKLTRKPKVPAKMGSDRLTQPTSTGKRWPVLFGIRATAVLMYVAQNSYCLKTEMMAGLDTDEYYGVHKAVRRLRAMGMIIGNFRYELNPAVPGYLPLKRLLRQMGLAFGVEKVTNYAPRAPHQNAAIAAPLPRDLFWTETRTNILAFIALMGESYLHEIRIILPIDDRSTSRRLDEFIVEGVLCKRTFKRVVLYSLNPQYPGVNHLESLLRRIGLERADLRGMANAAHLRRASVASQGGAREKTIIEHINGVRRSVGGVRADAGVRSRTLLKTRKRKTRRGPLKRDPS